MAILALDQRVGWQAAVLFADAHRAAAGVEAHADGARRVDRVVQASAVGEEVQVIACRRAPGEHEFGHRHCRGDVQHLGRDARPDGVERTQPREELGVLRRGNGARERLEEVVVRVDEPGQHDLAAAVDHFVGERRQLRGRADRDDRVAANEDAAAVDFPLHVVHRRDDRGVLEEQRPARAHDGNLHHSRCNEPVECRVIPSPAEPMDTTRILPLRTGVSGDSFTALAYGLSGDELFADEILL